MADDGARKGRFTGCSGPSDRVARNAFQPGQVDARWCQIHKHIRRLPLEANKTNHMPDEGDGVSYQLTSTSFLVVPVSAKGFCTTSCEFLLSICAYSDNKSKSLALFFNDIVTQHNIHRTFLSNDYLQPSDMSVNQ